MTYLLAFGFFVIFAILMTLGVMAKRKPIQGSCGGLANVGVDKVCNCETTCEAHQNRLYQISEPMNHDLQAQAQAIKDK
ncbi:(Na+)-NQR maturation NqrM [Vibrio mimicus]|nr:(Na+)-NQR maturation NqrM [Vibrio mimicus]QXC56425.1 (Na+)-NQR maturation NqrM [Vibrio mimicus]